MGHVNPDVSSSPLRSSSCSWEGAGGGRSLVLPHGSRALRPLHREDRPSGLAGQQPQVRGLLGKGEGRTFSRGLF